MRPGKPKKPSCVLVTDREFAAILESENQMDMTTVKARTLHVVVGSLLVASVSIPAMADNEYFDNARVVSVTPQVERVNSPRQECHTEYVQETYSNPNRSSAGAIIGGIAGGLLGSTIGRGNGRVAGAAVGAGVGAVVGDRVDNSNNTTTGTRPVDRCVTVDNWQTVPRGYLVTYNYNGHEFTTVTDRDPGQYIQVRVGVSAGADSNTGPSAYNGGYAPAPVIYRESAPVVVYGGYAGHPDWGRGRGWDRGDRHHDFW